jgi:hypothetical protein
MKYSSGLLALLLFSSPGWQILEASTEEVTPPTAHTMKLKNLRHSPWTPITVEMLSATTRTSEKVPARKAIFEYSDIFGTRTVPSTVFVSPTSRAVWVGPEQEFYVETDSGIKGGKLNGGFLLWCDSLAQNQAVTNIDAAIREFEDGRELGEMLTAKVPGYEPDRAKLGLASSSGLSKIR